MNQLTIIGNLTKDPEKVIYKTHEGDVTVCKFTIAVNTKKGDEDKADFFRVSAWRGLGDLCYRYLRKGRKACVIGAVACETYTTSNNEYRATMHVNAEKVEFLTPRGDADDSEHVSAGQDPAPTAQSGGGFTAVETDELPF